VDGIEARVSVSMRMLTLRGGLVQNAVTVLTTTLRAEGPRALLKGWVPAYVRLGPHTIITFLTLEQLKRWHRTWRG
jgi:solute carrier family 25 (mitochondrial dicarboxylate transporter), member 10